MSIDDDVLTLHLSASLPLGSSGDSETGEGDRRVVTWSIARGDLRRRPAPGHDPTARHDTASGTVPPVTYLRERLVATGLSELSLKLTETGQSNKQKKTVGIYTEKCRTTAYGICAEPVL